MTRQSEDAAMAFAIHADTNGLTLDEGRTLAQEIADAVLDAAEDRVVYLPTGPGEGRDDG